MIFRRSVYKTQAQVAEMVPAGIATAAALEAVRLACKPGITTLELDAIAERTIREHGGEPNFMLVPGYKHTICASVNDDVVHGIPSERVLEPGDILSVDCGALVSGWNGDAAFTVVLDNLESGAHLYPDRDPAGDRHDDQAIAERKRLSAVTEGALWNAIACLARARHLNEVGSAIEDYVRSRSDFGILTDYTGHGIGRAMHEEPTVFNYRVASKGVRVKPGLVVAIEPMLVARSNETYVRDDGWAVATVDGGDGAHWEHSVAVHEHGIWVLTSPDGGAAALTPFGVTPVAP